MNKSNGTHYKKVSKRKKNLVIIIVNLIILLLIAAALVFFFFWYLNPRLDDSLFKQVPVDKYVEKFSEPINNTGGEFKLSSFEFKDQLEFVNGEAEFGLKNPPNATQSAIVKLQITDAEMKKVNGSTGRTPVAQSEIEKDLRYNPQNVRVTIAQSGQIPPGNILKKIKLANLPDGSTLKKGTYSGIMFLDFIDSETSEKSFVNTQFPVKITVK
jgi:hypothetical protein